MKIKESINIKCGRIFSNGDLFNGSHEGYNISFDNYNLIGEVDTEDKLYFEAINVYDGMNKTQGFFQGLVQGKVYFSKEEMCFLVVDEENDAIFIVSREAQMSLYLDIMEAMVGLLLN